MRKFFRASLLIVLFVLFAVSCSASPTIESSGMKDISEPEDPVVTTTFQQRSYFYNGAEGRNAMELLKELYLVKTKDFGSGLGEFVESINGVSAASDEFWAFYVNGKSSNIGASSYSTKSDDLIEWRLEKIR